MNYFGTGIGQFAQELPLFLPFGYHTMSQFLADDRIILRPGGGMSG